MCKCPKCERKLVKVFNDTTDELAIASFDGEIILGNCCESEYNYYCEYCDEFSSYNPNISLSGSAFLNRLIFTSRFHVNFKSPA